MAKLINRETREEVKEGTIVTDFRGDTAVLVGFREPHKPSSTGRVLVKEEGSQFSSEYFPSVFGLEIVDHQFS